MRAKTGFIQAQTRLRLAASAYRIEQRANTPYIRVYCLRHEKRKRTARRFRADDDGACQELANLLLQADADLRRGGRGLDWDVLDTAGSTHSSARYSQTWGSIRRLIMADIAPGGIKARDRSHLACFKDRGYFGTTYADDTVALPEHLERYALFTATSLLQQQKERDAPLVPRPYNAKGFAGILQLVNHLAVREVAIATPALKAKLAGLRKAAGRQRTAAPRFIPETDDVQDWLDQLQALDPLRGWVMAMIATYGLRPHEVWHLDTLPGERPEDPTLVEVGAFEAQAGGSETKTGHRFALALPADWLDRYRLNDLQHARAMLAELRRRHPVRTIELPDGSVQFWNNASLGHLVTHWLRNKGREDRELPVKLFGWHQPRQLPGKPKPKRVRQRAKAYDLRHAWALRAKATTTWSAALKAASMGHSEAVHARRYLVEEQSAHKLANMLRLRALDEGGAAPTLPRRLDGVAVAGDPLDSVDPQLLELARKLLAAGLS